jgi:hypothetical protein
MMQNKFKIYAKIRHGTGYKPAPAGAIKFQPWMYDLHEIQYLIENDTTLRQIRWLNNLCPDNRAHDTVVDNMYKFFEYKSLTKKNKK